MTTGEKLIKLRKEKGYTQEQLADILGVSRQSVSKWESDVAFPETEKLIKLSELYNVCVDYLLKESCSEPFNNKSVIESNNEDSKNSSVNFKLDFFKGYEYKSKKTIFGMPLVHINIGLTRKACGFIAIGLRAKGIISLGVFSLGLISGGVFSLGLISLACFALGLIAIGAASVGLLAIGSIAIGLFALGAIAIGQVANGALAIGNYYALGDYARAYIAVGIKTLGDPSDIAGSITFTSDAAKLMPDALNEAINENVPAFFRWFCMRP